VIDTKYDRKKKYNELFKKQEIANNIKGTTYKCLVFCLHVNFSNQNSGKLMTMGSGGVLKGESLSFKDSSQTVNLLHGKKGKKPWCTSTTT